MFGWLSRPVKPARPLFAIEDEGGAAGLAGKTREDCPHDEARQSREWNSWVYGCETAQAEVRTINNGVVNLCSTTYDSPITQMTVGEAVEAGYFRPRYAKADLNRSST